MWPNSKPNYYKTFWWICALCYRFSSRRFNLSVNQTGSPRKTTTQINWTSVCLARCQHCQTCWLTKHIWMKVKSIKMALITSKQSQHLSKNRAFNTISNTINKTCQLTCLSLSLVMEGPCSKTRFIYLSYSILSTTKESLKKSSKLSTIRKQLTWCVEHSWCSATTTIKLRMSSRFQQMFQSMPRMYLWPNASRKWSLKEL